jgi:hypothetical protein
MTLNRTFDLGRPIETTVCRPRSPPFLSSLLLPWKTVFSIAFAGQVGRECVEETVLAKTGGYMQTILQTRDAFPFCHYTSNSHSRQVFRPHCHGGKRHRGSSSDACLTPSSQGWGSETSHLPSPLRGTGRSSPRDHPTLAGFRSRRETRWPRPTHAPHQAWRPDPHPLARLCIGHRSAHRRIVAASCSRKNHRPATGRTPAHSL